MLWLIVGCQMSMFIELVFCSRNSTLPTQCSLTFVNVKQMFMHSAIPIHHDGVNHWFLPLNITDTVVVYDFVYKAPHRQEVKKLLFLFYANLVVDNELVLKYSDVMKQVVRNDPGLFCIAYGVDLSEGNDPLDIEYDQICMWWRLMEFSKKENWLCSKEIQGILTAEEINIQKLWSLSVYKLAN